MIGELLSVTHKRCPGAYTVLVIVVNQQATGTDADPFEFSLGSIESTSSKSLSSSVPIGVVTKCASWSPNIDSILSIDTYWSILYPP